MLTKKGYHIAAILEFSYNGEQLSLPVPLRDKTGLDAVYAAIGSMSYRQDIPLYIEAQSKQKASATLQKQVERIALHQEQLISAIYDLLTTYDGVLHPKARTSNAAAVATAKEQWREAQRTAQRSFLSTLPGKIVTDMAKSRDIETVGRSLPELIELLCDLSLAEE